MQGNFFFQVDGKYYMYWSVTACTYQKNIADFLSHGKKCRTESELHSYMSPQEPTDQSTLKFVLL